MSRFPERPHKALVVVDVQHEIIDPLYRRDEVVDVIGRLVDRARAAGEPVVWIQHSDEDMPIGSPQWEYVPELTMREDEPLVHKVHPDAFEDTELDDVLREVGVGEVVIVGAYSDACVRATLHGAFGRGYDTTLVADGHTTPDRTDIGGPTAPQTIALTNRYWTNHTGAGRVARVVPSGELEL